MATDLRKDLSHAQPPLDEQQAPPYRWPRGRPAEKRRRWVAIVWAIASVVLFALLVIAIAMMADVRW